MITGRNSGRRPPQNTGTPADGIAGFARQTRQRQAVLRGLASHHGFVTAQALHTELLAAGDHLALTTVYNTLHALTTAGLADTARDPADGQLYRIRQGRGWHSHQYYLICRICRHSVTVTSPVLERWVSAQGRRHGFTDVRYVVEITGVCTACAGLD